MAGKFSAQVSDWVAKTKENVVWVYRESAQRTVEFMQVPRGAGGNMRVDTGFLRASLVATTGVALPSQTFKPEGVSAFAYDAATVNLVIAGAEINEPITVVYTANYARPREYGSRGQAGDRFVGLAAQQWNRTVNDVCAEARARSGG